MIDWNLVLLMVGIHALMFLTPGPDSIVVVSRALAQGPRHAFAAIFGVVSAGFFFVPAIAFGLDFVNSLSPAIWMTIRAAGAAYLAFIGYRMLRAALQTRNLSKGTQAADDIESDEPLFGAFLQGLLTNLGNPKMLVLLTSFLPQFVAEDKGNISMQILVLGGFMYLNGLVCFAAISIGAIALKERVVQRLGSGTLAFWGSLTAGGTMLGVGVWMMFAPIRFFLSPRNG
ncbi:MAG: LysE family translocator [Pseudomonadota bacterium]